MPPTDSKAATPQGRTRLLLILFGVVAVGALIYTTWPAAEPKSPPSNQGRDARKPQPTTGATGSLEVRLDELKQPPAGSAETTRNPFKFYVKPPPSPPPTPVRPTATAPALPTSQSVNPGAPNYVPPPITIKFIGVLEKDGSKWAIFSDGKGQPQYAKEGQTVLGQYKLLKIGVESVTMSYLDGRGVQTIPMRGGE
ncbi:MAG TPA: hypothetical protein VH138_14495 [Vicinamibacterales bacterium]|jgi:hypothetical protein|nr:hypothetical protein [Vicinamibacterales bacterium]